MWQDFKIVLANINIVKLCLYWWASYMTVVLSLLMAIYIIVPITIIGFVFGVFLFESGSMRPADLRKLLGLFFSIVLTTILIQQTIDEGFHFITDKLFSLSGHYVMSDAILSLYLLILLILLIEIQPWKSRCSFTSLGILPQTIFKMLK